LAPPADGEGFIEENGFIRPALREDSFQVAEVLSVEDLDSSYESDDRRMAQARRPNVEDLSTLSSSSSSSSSSARPLQPIMSAPLQLSDESEEGEYDDGYLPADYDTGGSHTTESSSDDDLIVVVQSPVAQPKNTLPAYVTNDNNVIPATPPGGTLNDAFVPNAADAYDDVDVLFPNRQNTDDGDDNSASYDDIGRSSADMSIAHDSEYASTSSSSVRDATQRQMFEPVQVIIDDSSSSGDDNAPSENESSDDSLQFEQAEEVIVETPSLSNSKRRRRRRK